MAIRKKVQKKALEDSAQCGTRGYARTVAGRIKARRRESKEKMSGGRAPSTCGMGPAAWAKPSRADEDH